MRCVVTQAIERVALERVAELQIGGVDLRQPMAGES
jgi:hypothetical protein